MTFQENNLADLCEIVSSKRVFAASYQSEGIPFYRGKEISQLARGEKTTAELYISKEVYRDVISRTGPINPGDILLTAVGTLGNPYLVKESNLPFYFKDGNIVWLRNYSELIDANFLFYWLNSEYGRRKVLDTAIGSTQAALTISGLGEIEISFPSRSQQDGIVNILSAIDEKISVNNALSKTLEDIAQTIFKSWFIDFDPVKAKMAGEKPAGMDAATAALFPDTMEESELGLIPKGWKVERFGEVNNLLMGQSPPGDTYNSEGEGLPFYQGRTDFGFRFPKQRIFCTQENRVALPGEILVSVRAPVGDVNQAIEKCIIGRGVASALHKSNSGAYTFSLLKSLYPRLAYYNGEGTVFGAINRNDFNNMLIVEPPASLVDSFEASCGPMNAKIRSLFLSTEALIQLRDLLLPRLISGELQIPEEMLVS